MAQTTGIKNGTLSAIYVGSNKVLLCTNHKLDLGMNTRPATSKDSGGWEESLEGLRNANMSGEAFFAEDAAYGFSDLLDLIKNRTKVTVKWSSEVAGDVKYTASAYLTKLSLDSKVEDSETYSFELKITGSVVDAVVA